MFDSILCSRLVVVVSYIALALSSVVSDELCSVIPYSYTAAMSRYPDLSTALSTLENYPIASWYTDRSTSSERAGMMARMLSQCADDTRLSIVVYGIPNKDCSGGFSTAGSVTNTDNYKAFLKELADAVGDRKVLYVVEPDALGLLAQDNGCGASAGYLGNLKVAVDALSVNPNAQLYVDVGYWMLDSASNAAKIATVMKQLQNSGRVKGVTINTSNYRSNQECARYCTNLQTAMGDTSVNCIVDTARNYNGSPTTDWCNVPTAGIGRPPSSNTGYSNLDYFMWIKPPGESDGNCWGGPTAGSFFYDGFKLLWDQGYFVKELGMAKIGESSSMTSAPVTSTPTSAPTSTPTFVPGTIGPVTFGPVSSAPATITPVYQYTTAPITAPSWSYAPGPCRFRKRLRTL